MKAGNKAFGELVVHVEHLYANIRAHNIMDTLATIKCGLASREGIWLVTFSGSTPTNMIQMKWTDKGSAAMLRSFFREENRTSLVLDELLVSMKLEEDHSSGLVPRAVCLEYPAPMSRNTGFMVVWR